MATKKPQPAPAERKIYVRIISGHPHAGRSGWIDVSEHGGVRVLNVLGMDMVQVHFADGESCYSQQQYLRHDRPTSPPPPRKKAAK